MKFNAHLNSTQTYIWWYMWQVHHWIATSLELNKIDLGRVWFFFHFIHFFSFVQMCYSIRVGGWFCFYMFLMCIYSLMRFMLHKHSGIKVKIFIFSHKHTDRQLHRHTYSLSQIPKQKWMFGWVFVWIFSTFGCVV